jgi:hypothetical protein
VTSSDAVGEARVIVGVDTHRDEHVAVAIDRLGARLGAHRLPTTLRGYEGLDRWATRLGEGVAFETSRTDPHEHGDAPAIPSDICACHESLPVMGSVR